MACLVSCCHDYLVRLSKFSTAFCIFLGQTMGSRPDSYYTGAQFFRSLGCLQELQEMAQIQVIIAQPRGLPLLNVTSLYVNLIARGRLFFWISKASGPSGSDPAPRGPRRG